MLFNRRDFLRLTGGSLGSLCAGHVYGGILPETVESKLDAEDFAAFCRKYIQIHDPKDGPQPFELYNYQKRIIHIFDENQNVIFYKFRQAGLDTLMGIWGLWKCMTSNDENIRIMTPSYRCTCAVRKIIHTALVRLECDGIQYETGRWRFPSTKSKLSISNRYRGENDFSHLILSEAGFNMGLEERFRDLCRHLRKGAKIFAYSTSNPHVENVDGFGWFVKTMESPSRNKDFEFSAFHLNYREHPMMTPQWAARMKEAMGTYRWRREYEGRYWRCSWLQCSAV